MDPKNFEVIGIRKGSGNIEAFVDLKAIDGERELFKLKGFRVVKEAPDTYFIGLPSRKGQDGKWHAQFLPSDEMKDEINKVIMDAFLRFEPEAPEELADVALQVSDMLHRNESAILGKPTLSFKEGSVRAVDLMGYRFITQNPQKETRWGLMARDGARITWVVKETDKQYVGRVVDGEYTEL